MSGLEIWLFFTVIPGIDVASFMLTSVAWLALLFAAAVVFVDGHNPKLLVFPIIALVLTGLLSVLTPSKADMALIVGGEYVAQLEGAENIPPNVVNAINKALESYLND